MRTFGLGRMDCADCFKTENDWCPAIIVPLCTMNCGPAVFVNGVQLAEQAPRGSEANRIKWENLERNAKWFSQTYDSVTKEGEEAKARQKADREQRIAYGRLRERALRMGRSRDERKKAGRSGPD